MIDRNDMTCKLPHINHLPYHKPMFPSHQTRLLRYLLLLLLLPFNSSASSPNILVSIKPLHSLVSHITQDVTSPQLLLDKQLTAHHFQLKPSQKRKLLKADVFIYSSNNIESFVEKLEHLQGKTRFVQASLLSGVAQLPNREFGHHHSDHSHDSHNESDIDGHVWLSINNAKQISLQLTRIFIELDPEHKQQYEKNSTVLISELNKLQQTNSLLLKATKDQSFLVYHDAYQYFEHENQITNTIFVTSSPEASPGIKRIKQLKQLIARNNIQCVFYEPPSIPPLLQTLTEDRLIKLVPLDPIGSQLDAGENHYFELMRQTATKLHDCLSSTNGQ